MAVRTLAEITIRSFWSTST